MGQGSKHVKAMAPEEPPLSFLLLLLPCGSPQLYLELDLYLFVSFVGPVFT